jgi:dCMP deaminase
MQTPTAQRKCITVSKSKEDRIKYIMIMMKYYANMFSDDTTTKVGAVFIDDNFQILAVGTNHSLYKMDFNHKDNIFIDTYLKNNEIPNTKPKQKKKYQYIEHAERNAIFNATNNHISLKDSICITTLVPCVDCAKAIISVGVKEVYTFCPSGPNSWADIYVKSKELFELSNIKSTILKITSNDLEKVNIGTCGWETSSLNNETNLAKGGFQKHRSHKKRKSRIHKTYRK